MRHIQLHKGTGARFRRLLTVGSALCLAAAAGAGADAVDGSAALSAGDRGYGLTVLRGARLDTFAVEILGLEADALAPGVDLILARLSGAGLEETGVVRGMSGSPVYVGGRLIGAVAYGWSFSKVPICGITPIDDMLGLLDRSLEPPASRTARAATEDSGRALVLGGPGAAAGMIPLAAPVWVAGATGHSADVFAELLRPLGLEVVTGPGGGTAEAGSAPGALEPGSAAGAQLVRGDLTVTAIGTVTAVDGDRVVAFGHPMLGLGGVDLPLAGAHIYGVMPSQQASFKLGAATEAVGALRQDRLPGVAGLVGARAALLPVAVSVGDRTFSFEILPQRLLVPGLARGVLLASLESRERLAGDATLELITTIDLGLGRRVEREQVYSGSGALIRAALEAAEPLGTLVAAPFPGLTPESVSFRARVRGRVEAAELIDLRLSRARPAPGDSIQVSVHLQPYQRPRQTVHVPMAVPAGMSPGTLTVRVGSARQALVWDSQRRSEGIEPRSADELVFLLNRPRRTDDLVVELVSGEEGLTLDGRELPGLPPSARAVLGESHSAGHLGTVRGRVVARHSLRTRYALTGDLEARLEVTVP